MVARRVGLGQGFGTALAAVLAFQASPARADPPSQPIEDIAEQVDATRDKTADANKNSQIGRAHV